MNEETTFIVMKLITGETLMATYFDDSEDSVFIVHPMLIKTIPYMHEGKIKESVSIVPWSSFTSDIHYEIDNKNIVYIKELHDLYINNYLDAVDESLKTYEISSVEELHRHLKDTGQIDNSDDTYTFAIEGNETVN